jgi:hypothetical protein
MLAGSSTGYEKIYVTVENVTFLGLLKCWVQGQKVVAFRPQTMHRDEMELSLITFRGDLDCVRYNSTYRGRCAVCSYTGHDLQM